MIVATAGHVDHGKTALIKHLTGTDTDRLEEEKKRGLTINLGFAYDRVGDDVIAFVDVPGHIDFIHNMLAGVGCIDFALLVVAADDGVMPQTREHLNILNLLGVNRGAVALSKTDLVDQQRLDHVQQDITAVLHNTHLQQSPIFCVSNHSGLGIDELKTHLHKLAQDESENPLLQQIKNQYCRFSIDRVFTVKGIGTVVTGTLLNGSLSVGDKLVHAGSEDSVRVKGLRVNQDEVNAVSAGSRVAMNISLDANRIHRGDWLCSAPLNQSSRDMDAELWLVDTDKSFLQRNSDIHFHHNASHTLAQVRQLQFDENAKASDSNSLWVRIKTRDPIYALFGDRFIIRDAAGKQTLGGGRFVDMFPPSRKRQSEERASYLACLNQDTQTALASLLTHYDGGIHLGAFARARNLNVDGLSQLLEGRIVSDEQLLEDLHLEEQCLNSATNLVLLEEANKPHVMAMGKQFFCRSANLLLNAIDDIHQNMPERLGVAPLDLKRPSGVTGDYSLFQLIVNKLLRLGVLSRTGTLVHKPHHQARDRAEDVALFARMKPLLLKAKLTSPRTRELSELLSIELKLLDVYLHRLCLAGKLAQVATNRYYLPETLLQLAAMAEELVDQSPENMFTVIEYRDRSQIGRNLCIQILEYFDRQGFTLRRGNRRLIRKAKELVFSAAND